MEWVLEHGGVENIPLYNCSAMKPEEWSARDGVKHPISGTLDLVYGILVELIYLPCIFVMFSKDLFNFSCYKIMILLGLVDICAIAVNSITTGILLIDGAVFCTYPDVIFYTGSLGLGAWCTACLICLVLVINRLFDILKPTLVKTYFSGNRTYFVLLFPLLYGVYFGFFTPPVVFTSRYQAWFFDPFIFPDKGALYQNYPHTANNLMIVVITCLLYGYLCVALNNQFHDNYLTKSNRSHKSIFIQSTIICMANLIASIIYVVMQFFPVPDWMIVVGHMGWQLGHGCPAVIYISMNHTVRNKVLILFSLKKPPMMNSITPASNHGHHPSTLNVPSSHIDSSTSPRLCPKNIPHHDSIRSA